MIPFAPSHVFVVTYGRSGSTLLQNILNALPRTCIRGENDGVAGLLAQTAVALDAASPAASLREHAITTTPTHPWYGAEDHDPQGFARSLARAFNTHVLRPPPGTLRAGAKEIRWHDPPKFFASTLDFLAETFPGSRFVFNLRDHAAVARSGWWADQNPDRVRDILTGAEALYAAYTARRPDLCLTLRYEEYTADTDALKPMFDHIGAGWDPDMVRTILAERLDHLKRRPRAPA